MVKQRKRNTISSSKLIGNINENKSTKLEGSNYFIKGDSSSSSDSSESSSSNVIILKHGEEVVTIYMDNIKEKLESLYEVRNVRIAQLSQEHKNKFISVTTVMNAVRNTSSYSKILSLINEIFSKASNNIIPGTVNAYFIGCKSFTNFTPFACSPVCSGSNQPVDMGDGWSVCDKYTILFEEKNNSFLFTNNPDNKEDAYIFISSSDNFKGFTAEEKKALSNKGIKRIKIVSYDQTGKNTVDITNDFTPLEDIKVRVQDIVDGNSSSGNGWYIFLWVLLGLIVVLVIVLIIFFAVSAKRKKMPSEQLFESMANQAVKDNKPLSTLARTPRSRISTSINS